MSYVIVNDHSVSDVDDEYLRIDWLRRPKFDVADYYHAGRFSQ